MVQLSQQITQSGNQPIRQPIRPPQTQSTGQIPESFLAAIRRFLPETAGERAGQTAAQLLWQRGIRQVDRLNGFLDPSQYQPASPWEFGPEMQLALSRLQQAYANQEKLAIWGDFDTDGITATAVLWEGLGAFFGPEQLTYWIPNRLTAGHGLSRAGLEQLASQGYRLIVTGDTGSSRAELELAHGLGFDLIVTDHHRLPAGWPERPPVCALLNPLILPPEHPLAHLSGVAVAYKLIEALYDTLPEPRQPLSDLLDLVAIGLIADLVELKGNCRYLAQIGIARLRRNQGPNPPRPGIAKLLELCRKTGDRPTDVSFGLAPRINAISRIYGEAQIGVELLTSRNPQRCQELAQTAELANARRRVLQRRLTEQVNQQLAEIDLSTTAVIVLSDPQWEIGLLGPVAGQIAQTTGRPTILLSSNEATGLAQGSARSVGSINLYDLLQQQAHLLERFGGHPLAAGLSLPVENISSLRQVLNQQVRALGQSVEPGLQADCTVTVADLGQALFQELKLLEPYGMGNPVPKLLIKNAWFSQSWHHKLRDLTGRKLEYVKTEFELRDESCSLGFPGVWWGHYKEELPTGVCDVLVELDFNSYTDSRRVPRYEVRLVAWQPAPELPPNGQFDEQLAEPAEERLDWPPNWLLDWRNQAQPVPSQADLLLLTACPTCWEDLQDWAAQARQTQQRLALAYGAADLKPARQIWQALVNLAQTLSQTGQSVAWADLQVELDLSKLSLEAGLAALRQAGFRVTSSDDALTLASSSVQPEEDSNGDSEALTHFLRVVNQEQFMRRYFCQAPLAVLQTALEQH
ncbi:MAG: single-stranded-DNA-specific exonuclease RecJ [Elainella sp.]